MLIGLGAAEAHVRMLERDAHAQAPRWEHTVVAAAAADSAPAPVVQAPHSTEDLRMEREAVARRLSAGGDAASS